MAEGADLEASTGISPKRIWQLDVARGSAILTMVLYHIIVDLTYSDGLSIGVQDAPMRLSAMLIGSSFLFIAGISLVLERERHAGKEDGENILKKQMTRGARIFAWGLLITIATYVIVPDRFIAFGILHCIGASIVMAAPLVRMDRTSLAVGILLMVSGFLISGHAIDGWGLVWLGVPPAGFTTLDYYPVLPWTGVLLVGVWAGNMSIPYFRRLGRDEAPGTVRRLAWAGRHSLQIYLIHQPIILAALLILGFKPL